MPVGSRPLPTQNRTAVQVFELLAAGQPVPPALLAAQARADEARASRPHRDLPDAVVEKVGASISDASFITSYCGGSWDIISCFPLHKNYNTSYLRSDVDEVYAVACSNSGVVTLQVRIGSDPWKSWDVSAGYCRAYHWTSGWLNEDVRVKVVNVGSSDDYNLSQRFNY